MFKIFRKVVLVALLLPTLVACSEGKNGDQISPESEAMNLESTAFTQGGHIPSAYTCDGEDLSPPLYWFSPPAGTQSFVLIVDDPDAKAVAGYTWDHWILYDIPSSVTSLPQGESAGTAGKNHFGKQSYGGPCPPGGTHTYEFRLYALDAMLNLPAGAGKEEVNAAMSTHILAETKLQASYTRHQ